jgi:hypothetical protein
MRLDVEKVLTKHILNYIVFQEFQVKTSDNKVLHEGTLFEEEINDFLEKVESYLSFYLYRDHPVKEYKNCSTKIVCQKCNIVRNSSSSGMCLFQFKFFFPDHVNINFCLPKIVLDHRTAKFCLYDINMKIFLKWPLLILFYCFQKKNIFYSNF